MHKVPFTNDTPDPQYAPDGTRVMPGQTRMVDAQTVHTAAVAEPTTDPLLGLLDNKIPDIVAHLANLDRAALDTLLAAEIAGKTRKTLVEAIELRIMEVEDAAKLAGAGDAEAAAAAD